jgi:maleylpyruvate isomerase
MLRSLARDFGERDDGPRLVVRAPEVGHDLAVGAGGPVVTGPGAAVVAWLIGRSNGETLAMRPPGPLPVVPAWG